MDINQKKQIIIYFNNHQYDEILSLAYTLKPFKQDTIDSAKLIVDWFNGEKGLNFDKIIERFLSLSESKENELNDECLYMAGKIALFNKRDAQQAASIVRKSLKNEEMFPGISYLGFYIYQNGLLNDEPDYRLAMHYLINSVKFPMPWFESTPILEKRSVDEKIKYHYATQVLKFSNFDAFRKHACEYLVNYYSSKNLLINLKELYEENVNHPDYFEENLSVIASGYNKLGNFYSSKKDFQQAIECYKDASGLGNDAASETLGICYYQGVLGLDVDYSKAFSYLDKVNSKGNGKFLLGLMYENGQGVEKNMETAFNIYLSCSKANFPEAFYKLGRMYALGIYKNKDEFLTHRYFDEYIRLVGSKIPESRKQKIQEYYDSFKKGN